MAIVAIVEVQQRGSAMTQEIEIKVEGGVQSFASNAQDKKNAFTGRCTMPCPRRVDSSEKNDAIACHVFLGSGGVFSAGNDINDFLRRAQAAASSDSKGIPAPSLDFIRRLPKVTKPMVAAVDGLAIGIGTTLLLHCDLVYASPTASLRTPLDLGLTSSRVSIVTARRAGLCPRFSMISWKRSGRAALRRASSMLSTGRTLEDGVRR